MSSSFLIEAIDGGGDGGVELFDRSKGLMGEEVAFEIAPGAFDIIEFGRVFGQPLDGKPGAFGERGSAQLAGVDRAVVEHQNDRFGGASRSRAIKCVEAFQEVDEVGASLGAAAMDDELGIGVVKRADQRQLARLAGGGHAQVGAAPGPGMRQIRMGQRLGLVGRQQHDIARFGLLFQQFEPEPGAVDRLGVLSAGEAMTRSAPAPTIFFSVLLS